MASPQLTLRLMGVPEVPGDAPNLRLVGALVGGVGLSYFVPIVRRAGGGRRLVGVLEGTAVVRLTVAAFVAAAVLAGAFPWQWSSVWITDLALGTFQLLVASRYDRCARATAH
jgi:hypothetical protein